jgi:hypothetical protein
MGDYIDQSRALMIGIAREVIGVAQALGIKPVGFYGYEPDLYMSGGAAAIDAR